MKRKIERYLSNNDKEKIRYLHDGRFNFHGDLEGVLVAVRDVGENGNRSGGTGRNSNRKSKKSSSNGASGIGSTRTPCINGKTTTFSNDFSGSRSAYTNSASRNLFEDTCKRNDVNDWDVDVASNIFVSPPPSNKKYNSNRDDDGDHGKADSDQKRQLRSTFTTGRASIMETPNNKAARPARSPTFHSIQTPDVNHLDLRGFTPLSKNSKGNGNPNNFAEILDSGFFSPGGPLGKDFVMEAAAESGSENPNNISALSTSFAEGVKTPHASDHPRMCIANVRFGDSPEKKTAEADRRQREVAISPICKVSLSALTQKRKRRSLFGDDAKKHKPNNVESGRGGVVTPSYSVSSNTTVTTHPLTVCSSASSVRTTLSLDELSKVRSIQIMSSSLRGGNKDNGTDDHSHKERNDQNSPPECSGMEPKHITQDTPSAANERRNASYRASPPFSPPPSLDKVGSILQSARKLDVGTPAEKFWSSVGGLDNFTPFKVRDECEGNASGLMSPTSNSKFFETLLEDKGPVSKPAKPSAELLSN
mmetsp:Transcript_36207/g.76313  ORF Transcript_36207/g.76313 Transcript_36207/m.76313 type:complete len:534 (+) Transcript_36207:1102-2703(+)